MKNNSIGNNNNNLNINNNSNVNNIRTSNFGKINLKLLHVDEYDKVSKVTNPLTN